MNPRIKCSGDFCYIDDATKSIDLIVGHLCDSIKEGLGERKQNKEKMAKEKAEKEAVAAEKTEE